MDCEALLNDTNDIHTAKSMQITVFTGNVTRHCAVYDAKTHEPRQHQSAFCKRLRASQADLLLMNAICI
jgi:hypothetical protein